MICPNCSSPTKMRTKATFDTGTAVHRSKQCVACRWKFTTIETISDEIAIPNVVRNINRRK